MHVAQTETLVGTPLTPKPAHEWMQYLHVIVFDGVCNWCNAWVNIVLRYDRTGAFRFGTLQSEAGQRLLRHLDLPTEEFDTFILLEGTHVFTRSTAAIRVLQQLSGFGLLAALGRLIPVTMRDALYGFIARNRYRWMGRRHTCRVPTPEERDRFV